MNLWKEVCTSPLLARATIILFLNKMDILESTLKAGVRVQTFVPTYGSQPNDVKHVVQCTCICSIHILGANGFPQTFATSFAHIMCVLIPLF